MSKFVDRAFSQKLERTEAEANASSVMARKKLFPRSGSEWKDFQGTYAMYDGVESPLTQTFGLGLFEDDCEKSLKQIESFFQQHGAPIVHEVSPLADADLINLLHIRGYRPIEYSSVLYRDLSDHKYETVSTDLDITVRQMYEGEEGVWAQTSALGWSQGAGQDETGLRESMYQFAKIIACSQGVRTFLAEIDGEPIATAALYVFGNMALIAGDSTIFDGRNRGAQNVLLKARLNVARACGCDTIMMTTVPGTQSQKNAEKNGFRLAYTRTKWLKECP